MDNDESDYFDLTLSPEKRARGKCDPPMGWASMAGR